MVLTARTVAAMKKFVKAFETVLYDISIDVHDLAAELTSKQRSTAFANRLYELLDAIIESLASKEPRPGEEHIHEWARRKNAK